MFYASEIISYMKLNRWESINAFLSSLKSHSWTPGLSFCDFIVTDVCDFIISDRDFKHYPGTQRVNWINALIVKVKYSQKKKKKRRKKKKVLLHVSVFNVS